MVDKTALIGFNQGEDLSKTLGYIYSYMIPSSLKSTMTEKPDSRNRHSTTVKNTTPKTVTSSKKTSHSSPSIKISIPMRVEQAKAKSNRIAQATRTPASSESPSSFFPSPSPNPRAPRLACAMKYGGPLTTSPPEKAKQDTAASPAPTARSDRYGHDAPDAPAGDEDLDGLPSEVAIPFLREKAMNYKCALLRLHRYHNREYIHPV
jgi:hypothetical protein